MLHCLRCSARAAATGAGAVALQCMPELWPAGARPYVHCCSCRGLTPATLPNARRAMNKKKLGEYLAKHGVKAVGVAAA